MLQLSSVSSSKLPVSSNVGLFLFEREKRPLDAEFLPFSFERHLQRAYSDGFKAKLGQISVVHTDQGKVSRFVFVGLGPQKEASLDSLRRAVASLARHARSMGLPRVYLRLPKSWGSSSSGQAGAEGALLGLYRYAAYKSVVEEAGNLESIVFLAKDSAEQSTLSDGLKKGRLFAESTIFARNLINQAPSDTTPEFLAKVARGLSGPLLKVKVYGKKEIERMGMGAVLGVNRGSAQPPYFLHLVYRPAGRANRRVGICGKGITFDSGGLSLKPAKSMETMKYDMAGAATVLSIFRALPTLRPRAEVHGFAPLTENMPGGRALKPGDVLKTMNGKTIEVLNTDAEGRLVLSDTLIFACRQGLDEVIDIATLTGACVIALGTGIAGIMGNDAGLVARLRETAGVVGEKLWELPLEPDYEQLIKSNIADVKNIGPVGEAGTIVGGLFLKQFVDPKVSWAHLDIASTGWTNAVTPISDIGATGVMVRTLLQYLSSYS